MLGGGEELMNGVRLAAAQKDSLGRKGKSTNIKTNADIKPRAKERGEKEEGE